ncbi:MAG TPA: YdcF family protein [Geobacteraceae bacterium]|nr:YdcF family protein [Geobacteraceae bacterium]
MSIIKGLLSLLVIILVAMAVLFVDFAYKTFSLHQQDVKTDAIVVLTGGRGRVEEGLRLFRENRARWLFLIGVDPSVQRGDLLKGRHDERDAEGIILEKVSRNTLENAIYSRDLIAGRNIRSISLITSRYHMKRATLIFRNMLPGEIAIFPHPVDSRNLKEEWWNDPGSFRLLFSEFYKYVMFRFFFLASGELRPALR